jgi:hypothetical protein
VTVDGRAGASRRSAGWLAGLGSWGLAMLGLGVIWWLDRLLREAGRVDLAPLGAEVAAPVLAAVSAATVGAVLASRRPRHPVGWLLLAVGCCLNASGVASAYASYGLLARPGALPAAREVSLYLPAIAVPTLALLGFVLLLMPTGHLPSPRWRWWARAAVAAPVLSLLAIALGPPDHGRARPGARQPVRPSAGSVVGCWSSTSSPSPSPTWPWWSGPGRWWCGSAGPAAPSASSCAGWRWPPC